jgi:phosphate transport system substrate-binding protein
VSITNAPGSGAYPISSFTWLLIRPDMADAGKARAMQKFLEWMLTPEARDMASQLQYAPLPDPVIALVKTRIAGLKANGKVLE